jgi:hypothetical protein
MGVQLHDGEERTNSNDNNDDDNDNEQANCWCVYTR